jgi:hypothetical protein
MYSNSLSHCAIIHALFCTVVNSPPRREAPGSSRSKDRVESDSGGETDAEQSPAKPATGSATNTTATAAKIGAASNREKLRGMALDTVSKVKDVHHGG